MKKLITSVTFSVALAAGGGLALAESHGMSAEDAIKARQTHMKLFAQNLGVLGGMAQGKVAYDATAAQAAADVLAENAQTSMVDLFPAGSDSDRFADTRALPAIWTNLEDFTSKAEALSVAALAMQDAAGQSLEAVQGAMNGLGGACGSCHQSYRKPK